VAVMPVSARCMKAKAIENQAVDRHSRCLVKYLSRRGHGGIPARLAEMRGGNVLLACHAVSACSGCMTAFPACGPDQLAWSGDCRHLGAVRSWTQAPVPPAPRTAGPAVVLEVPESALFCAIGGDAFLQMP